MTGMTRKTLSIMASVAVLVGMGAVASSASAAVTQYQSSLASQTGTLSGTATAGYAVFHVGPTAGGIRVVCTGSSGTLTGLATSWTTIPATFAFGTRPTFTGCTSIGGAVTITTAGTWSLVSDTASATPLTPPYPGWMRLPAVAGGYPATVRVATCTIQVGAQDVDGNVVRTAAGSGSTADALAVKDTSVAVTYSGSGCPTAYTNAEFVADGGASGSGTPTQQTQLTGRYALTGTWQEQ